MNDPITTPAITPDQVAFAKTWEGRSEQSVDLVHTTPVRGLAAALDRSDLQLEDGSVLPPLWHWLFFLPQAPQASIGEDGHPRLGGFMPPIPLPRRMWAGGRVHWHAPLHVGDRVRRKTTIVSVSHKAGRSGDLMFVLLRHDLALSDGTLAVSEEQDIVYRAPAQPGDPVPVPQAAPSEACWSRVVTPDPVLLFRYSALTFNGHRIHYDRPYATQREGYEGLVVHGPLIATLLADLAMRQRPASGLKSFSFRAVRPLLDLHSFALCGEPLADGQSARLWTRDHAGGLTMQAEATFA